MAAWRSPRWNRLAYDAEDDPEVEHQELVEYDPESGLSDEDDKNIPPSQRMRAEAAPAAGAEELGQNLSPDPGEPADVVGVPEEEIAETDPEFQGEEDLATPDQDDLATRAAQIDAEAAKDHMIGDEAKHDPHTGQFTSGGGGGNKKGRVGKHEYWHVGPQHWEVRKDGKTLSRHQNLNEAARAAERGHNREKSGQDRVIPPIAADSKLGWLARRLQWHGYGS